MGSRAFSGVERAGGSWPSGGPWRSARAPWRGWKAWFFLWFLAGAALAVVPGGQRLAPDRDVPVVALWRDDVGKLEVMDVETYLVGVVAAEMPALFHPEALKAQAVAARTFTLWTLAQGRSDGVQPAAHFSTSPAAGQAWMSSEALRRRWGGGREFQANWNRVAQAVRETRGQVMVYGGRVVEALYHSTSGGHTESAEHYFRFPKPYLQGVPDPYGAHSPHWRREIVLPKDQVYQALGVKSGDVEILARTGSGRAQRVRVGEREFSGRELRERLGLPSSWFQVEDQGEAFLFQVYGNGHGVGMSQYGADGMARAGYTYDEILRYYYRGVTLHKLY